MVDKRIVEYVANLAKIEISQEEERRLAGQLSKILDYIDKLKELDVEGIEPMRGLHIDKDVFRQDKVKSSQARDDILNNAPFREEDYFKIPKVID